MQLAKGYIRDMPWQRTQKDSHALFGTKPKTAVSANLTSFEAPIMTQATGSCWAHGTAQALYIARAAAGKPLLWVPSPRALYRSARTFWRKGYLTIPLGDWGSSPADGFSALNQWGIEPMGPAIGDRASDDDPATVNVEPTLDQAATEKTHLVTGTHRIDEQASDMPSQVAASLTQGMPVGIGFFADSTMAAWTPGPALTSTNPGDVDGGDHWAIAVGFDVTSQGYEYNILNSWGPGWGDKGHFRVTEAWLRQQASFYPQTGYAPGMDVYIYDVSGVS